MEPTRLGRYILVEKLTTGGMAEVYRAVATGPDGFRRIVAIKKILPCFADSPEFRKMFVDEASIAARLNHANIAQVYDFEIVDGVPYIAMEFVEGKDLRSILIQTAELGVGLPYALAAFVAMETAKGLYYVHSRRESSRPLNIVHRDVSPQNIMLGHSGCVKLVDFGIARAVDRQACTQAGTVKGKYAYMSPEQALGRPLDHRSDQFSLGVVLWEMLTLKRLFAAATEAETIANVLKTKVVPPHMVNPLVPERLSNLVMRALAKDPEHRYASMLLMYEALSDFLMTTGTYPDVEQISAFLNELFPDEMERLWQGEHLAFEVSARESQNVSVQDTSENAPPPESDGSPAASSVLAVDVPLEEPLPQDEPPQTVPPLSAPSVPVGRMSSRVMAGALGVLVLAFLTMFLVRYLSERPASEPMAPEPVLAELDVIQPTDADVQAESADSREEPDPMNEPVAGPRRVVGLDPTSAKSEESELAEEYGVERPEGGTQRVPAVAGEETLVKQPVLETPGTTSVQAAAVPEESTKVVMEFQVSPADSVLRINGERFTPGPVALDVKEGDTLRVEVRKGGFFPFGGKLPARHGGIHKITIRPVAYLMMYVEPRHAKVKVDGVLAEKGSGGEWAFTGPAGDEVLVQVELKGLETHTEVIELQPGEQKLRVRLRRQGSRARPSTPSSDDRSPTGQIEVQGKPWADVYFQDQRRGRTPVVLTVPPGEHKVKLVHLSESHTCTVAVQSGQTGRCVHDFVAVP